MNKIIKICLASVALGSSLLNAITVPYLNYRSQAFNAARELVGWQSFINVPCEDDYYGSLSVAAEYTASFNAKTITKALFGDCLSCSNNGKCLSIAIEGTKVAQRSDNALMAENFYLPSDFSSRVTFKPTIKNFIVDLNFYLGLDHICQGVYVRIHAPFCHTRWNMGMHETVLAPGIANYDPGYFNDTYVPANFLDTSVYGLERSKMLANFSEYCMYQKAITDVPNITYNPLANARIHDRALTKNGLAELTAAVGWNFFNCDTYTLGASVRVAAPTGNRPVGMWLFEPIVGQGHHWEFGGGLNARWDCWKSCDERHALSLYGDLNVTHLFTAHQCRTFDLCNSPLSRYMLALKFQGNTQNLGTTTYVPSYQFAKEFVPVANITTIPVDSSIALQADLVLKLAYTHCNWQCDIGYDFWCHSQEDLCTRCSSCIGSSFKNNTYGLKGDAFVFGFAYDSTGPTLATQGISLSATESESTIFKGSNRWARTTTLPTGGAFAWNQNPGIDNPFLANNKATPSLPLYTHENGVLLNPTTALWNQVNTSLNPVLLTEGDLDINSARVAGLSNKIFGHIEYIWNNCCCCTPYLGVGGEVEFGTNQCKRCGNQCSDPLENSYCSTVSLSQWGLWCKGGCAFN